MFRVQSICSNAHGQRVRMCISMQDPINTSYDLMSVCVCMRVQRSDSLSSCFMFFDVSVEADERWSPAHQLRAEAHLEADLALLAAEAGQHEEDEGEEAREGDGHHSQGRRPGQFTQRSAICRTHQELQTDRILAEAYNKKDSVLFA